MMSDGSAFSLSRNQDHAKVSVNVMTADGSTPRAFTCDQVTSETPTNSTVNFAKSTSYSTAQKYTNIANALLTNPQRVKIVCVFLPTR